MKSFGRHLLDYAGAGAGAVLTGLLVAGLALATTLSVLASLAASIR